jgi:predicted glycosyltransferase
MRLEEILLSRIHDLPGSAVVILGSPARVSYCDTAGSCSIKGYVSNEEKDDLMNRAKFVICRSGYTSMMDLAELDKRHALLIPTPGQTEQEYLSKYYAEKGWFFSKSQYDLSLTEDITTAMHYAGFPKVNKTAENTKRLYDSLLAKYLE